MIRNIDQRGDSRAATVISKDFEQLDFNQLTLITALLAVIKISQRLLNGVFNKIGNPGTNSAGLWHQGDHSPGGIRNAPVIGRGLPKTACPARQ